MAYYTMRSANTYLRLGHDKVKKDLRKGLIKADDFEIYSNGRKLPLFKPETLERYRLTLVKAGYFDAKPTYPVVAPSENSE